MAWITPKTDWKSSVDSSGVYNGDHFDWQDYNRVLNNMKVLLTLCRDMYGNVNSECTNMVSKSYSEFPYADEWNAFEQTLSDIDNKSYKMGYASGQKTYYENAPMPDYSEFNRIESAQLALYKAFITQQEGLRMLRFTLGFQVSSIQE